MPPSHNNSSEISTKNNKRRRASSSRMHPNSMLHLQLKGIGLRNVATGRVMNRVSSPVFVVSALTPTTTSRRNSTHNKNNDNENDNKRDFGIIVATSERISRNLNPSWPILTLNCQEACHCDLDQPIKIEVFDQNEQGENIATIGSFEATVRTILNRQAGRFTLWQNDNDTNVASGKIEIVIAMIEIVSTTRAGHSIKIEPYHLKLPDVSEHASEEEEEEGTASESLNDKPSPSQESLSPQQQQQQRSLDDDDTAQPHLRLVLQGIDLFPMPGKVTKSQQQIKPNRFYRIIRCHDDSSSSSSKCGLEEAYTSEVVPENDNPVWKEAMINLQELCNGDRRMPILISVWEESHGSGGRIIDMGSCQTTVSELLRRTRRNKPMTLTLTKGANHQTMGTLSVLVANIVGGKGGMPARWLTRQTCNIVSTIRNRAGQIAALPTAAKVPGEDNNNDKNKKIMRKSSNTSKAESKTKNDARRENESLASTVPILSESSLDNLVSFSFSKPHHNTRQLPVREPPQLSRTSSDCSSSSSSETSQQHGPSCSNNNTGSSRTSRRRDHHQRQQQVSRTTEEKLITAKNNKSTTTIERQSCRHIGVRSEHRAKYILRNMPKWDLEGDDSLTGELNNERGSFGHSINNGHRHTRRSSISSRPKGVVCRKQEAEKVSTPSAEVKEGQTPLQNNEQSDSTPATKLEQPLPLVSPLPKATSTTDDKALSVPSKNKQQQQRSKRRKQHRYSSRNDGPIRRTRSRFAAARGEPISRIVESRRNLGHTLNQFTEIALVVSQRRRNPNNDQSWSNHDDMDNNDWDDISKPQHHSKLSIRKERLKKLKTKREGRRKLPDNDSRLLESTNQGSNSGGNKKLKKAKKQVGKQLKSFQKVALQKVLHASTAKNWGPGTKQLEGKL